MERKKEVGVRSRARNGRCADSRWIVVSSRSAYWLIERSLRRAGGVCVSGRGEKERGREGERERGGGVLVEDSANFTAKALERANVPFGVTRENVKALGERFFTF